MLEKKASLSMACLLAGTLMLALSPISAENSLPGGRQEIPGLPPPVTGDAVTRPETVPQDPIQGKVEVIDQSPASDSDGGKPVEKPPAAKPAPKPAKTETKSKPAKTSSRPAPAKTKPARSKGKPVVQFPEDVLPKADASTRARPAAMRPQPVVTPSRYFYPRGYKRYIAPINPEKQRLHELAIEHFNRANYYGRRNQLKEAIAEYRQAITLNPEFADAYVGLSSAHMRTNDWASVFEEAEKALDLENRFMDPANIVQAQYNLSAAHCVTDDYGAARRMLKKVEKARHPAATALETYIEKNCPPDGFWDRLLY